MASTIKDVARRAGVSTATVSLVLSDRPGVRISDATRVRVREAAEELEFTPNIVARSLISGKSQMIGLIVNNIESPLIAQVTRGVERAARERRHHVIVSETEGAEGEMDTVRWLRSRGVDGLVMVSTLMRAVEVSDYLERERVPLVLINQQAGGESLSLVPDHHEVGRKAAELFLDAGYKRLGYLGYGGTRDNDERMKGFTEEAARRGAKVEVVSIADARTPVELSQAASAITPKLLGKKCDAVLCFNDYIAYGLLGAARDAGVNIPDDLAVIGIDNLPLGQVSAPPLASFDMNLMEIGRQAVDALLDKDAPPPPTLTPKFVYRASAGKVAHGE